MKESQSLEFKKSLAEEEEILETISAFSNTNGGKILVGIDENKDGTIKEIVGVKIKGKEIENLTNEIKQNTDPIVFPSIELVKMEGNDVLSIDVKKSNLQPVFSKARSFKRVGRSNIKLSAQEIREMTKESVDYSFTDLVCEGAKLEDIDEEKVKWFLKKANEERNFSGDLEASLQETLEKLGLMKEGKLLNAAILMFGKNPQYFFLQSRIRCARFKGIESNDYIDMKILDGTIPVMREKAMQFVIQHINHGVFFDANQRYDKWEYPLRALEEIFSNALAHRSYDTSSEIQVSIYDDRIEVWNPGELPKPLLLSDLKKSHRSVPRNKIISELLFLIKFIEKWGRGANRVIEEMKEAGLKEPEFQHLSGGFEVILHGPGKKFETEIERQKLHHFDFNERQKKALTMVNKNGEISRKDYMGLNNVSNKTAFLELKELVHKKVLQVVGKGRSTKYIIK